MVFKTGYRLMQVKSIAECSPFAECSKVQGEHSAILTTFIKLPFVIKIFVLSIFEWPLYTGFTIMQFFSSLLCHSREVKEHQSCQTYVIGHMQNRVFIILAIRCACSHVCLSVFTTTVNMEVNIIA